jgi:hypothetical protein
MMDYAGKIEKAKRYAQERERFRFEQFHVTFSGDNNPHQVDFDHGSFHCDCEFFITHRWCAHSRALEMMLDKMLPETVQA